MSQNQAILFDMGGTLDGDGLHWLDHFETLYVRAGISLSRETRRAAFDEAERRAAVDDEIARARLHDMIDRHVAWQFEYLSAELAQIRSRSIATVRARIVADFVKTVRDAARANVEMLAALKARGLDLGVVSNGCGNVDVLCEDLGYTPFLSLVVDSRRVGLYKPDPAIYIYAASKLGRVPSAIMMVGDSFERDVLPAKSIGMKTAWLQGPRGGACPDPSSVDITLRALADLPRALEAREQTVA
jgi:putative hydrolase of the HAD superfamily